MRTSTAKTFTRALVGAGAAATMVAALWSAPARSAADFSGKTIEWIIPFATGGGSDVWARFFAPHLSEALPGKPTVVVKNVPGGGSITGTNQFAERARPDGLTILGTSGSTQFPYLLRDPKVRYEYKDWTPVLASPTGGVVYVNPKTGVKTAKDVAKLKGQNLVYVSQGATSLDLVPLLAFELLGLDVKAVFGAKGRGDGRLAFERGETNIDYQTSSAYIDNVVPMVKAGNAVPLWSWGSLDEKGNLIRDPSFPDLPHFGEVYEQVLGKKPNPNDIAWKAYFAFFSAGYPAQKMVFLPKGTPKDIIDAYNQAFAKIIGNASIMEKAKEELGEYKQATGAAAEATLKVAIGVDDQARDYVLKWLKDRFQVEIK